MVFILGRMGDNKKALMLIIERLGDVQRVRHALIEKRGPKYLFICLYRRLLTLQKSKRMMIFGKIYLHILWINLVSMLILKIDRKLTCKQNKRIHSWIVGKCWY